jgi:hypothetical protein
MRVEVVVFGIESDGAIDFEECLCILVGLLNEPKIHLPDAGLSGVEGCTEFGIKHEALKAILPRLVAGGRLAGRLAGELERKSSHPIRRARVAMASITLAHIVGAADNTINTNIATPVSHFSQRICWTGSSPVNANPTRGRSTLCGADQTEKSVGSE